MPKHRLWPSLLASLVLALAGCSETESPKTSDTSEEAPPEYPVTWRFALEEIEGSVQHAYAEALKTRIEEESDGKIILDIFPYGSLGTSSQLTELTRNGSVDLAFASPGHLADLVPETGIFTLHYVLPDDDAINRALFNKPALTELFAGAYSEHNLKLMGFVPEGWMAWTANMPLRTPEDFQGLRIRTMTSDISAETFRAYGAEPLQTPYSQVYSDLQLQQIDGQTNPVFAIEEMNFYEVQSTMTVARAAQFISSIIANPEWYESLPANQQAWLESALTDIGADAWTIQQNLNQTRLETMLEGAGIQVVRLSEEERAAFREAAIPARKFYIEQTGKRGRKILDTLDDMIAELKAGAKSGTSADGD